MFTMIKFFLTFSKEFFFAKGFLLIIMLFLVLSCNNEDINPFVEAVNYPIKIDKIENFPEINYDFNTNPPTKNGVELGRKLFYEGKLSSNNAISCGFCHIQQSGFTHHGHTLSHGVFDRVGFRNSTPIQNMIYQKAFMWDGVVTDLNKQPLIPITAHDEMGETFPNIIIKLNQTADYPKLFKDAFGSQEITADKILKALAQFMVTMVSANSKYDKVVRNEGESFSTEESQGRELFKQKCASCHATDLFTDQSFRNTGLVYNSTLKDYGRYRVTFLESDKMKFRVPSLRNVELTAPYMHDGRFYTLDAVLNHYSTNLENNVNLDPLLKQNEQVGISLTTQEKLYLIAFLKTLTDYEFIKNKQFSEFP